MAEAAETSELVPIEQGEGVSDEEEYIEKLRKEFKPEDFALVQDSDLRRVIRGYAKEKERWKDTLEHLQIWIDALKAGFANIGFKPFDFGNNPEEMYENMKKWAGITVHGQDKFGHPVMYEDVANYDCDKVVENLEAALKFRERVFCQMWNKKHEISKKSGKMIYKQINVFNMNGIGVMSANKFKNVIQKMIQREGDMFPETVFRMYFINTSFWFKAAWAVISMFVHPVTKKKIQMLGSDYIKYMQEDVPLEQIPTEFGGKSSEPIRWGESWFTEPAEAQFPDLLKDMETAPADVGAEKKQEVETEPAEVAAAAEEVASEAK